MISMGYDVGTRFVKACVTKDNHLEGFSIIESGGDIAGKLTHVTKSALKAAGISKWKVKSRVATGYGASMVKKAAFVATEENCIAKAAFSLDKDIKTVVDTGALFINVATLNGNGTLDDHTQNDKCAAGSGKFLEILSSAMGIALSSISEKALESKTPYKLTNSCAVFSESEVITQVNAGTNSSDIVAGIIHSIASKIGTLVNKVDAEDKLAAVGGVAKIEAFRHILGEELDREIVTLPIDSQIAAAYGAALCGLNRNGRA